MDRLKKIIADFEKEAMVTYRAQCWQAMLDRVGTYDVEPKDKLGRVIIKRGGRPTGRHAFNNFSI